MATWVLLCGWPLPSPEVEKAPFFHDLAEGPDDVRAVWRHTSDGVRLRLASWPSSGGKGTVFLFPGRTEHIEKYGRVAHDLIAAGYGMLVVDWRGQGLSDRLLPDRRRGHVDRFSDYQMDVDVMAELACELALPEPWHLIAHSMGGCIGLRALINGLNMSRAVFSAPMWGIKMPAHYRPLAHVLPPIARALRVQNRYALTAKPSSYIAETPFNENVLTHDPKTFAWMQSHAASVEEFAIGGPTIQWVGDAVQEVQALFRSPRPTIPVITYLGTEEAIVTPEAIRRMHANWPESELRIIEGARHEMMMEIEQIRSRFFRETLAFFDEASATET